MNGFKQSYPGLNRGGEKYNTDLPNAQDGLTFNERRLDSARTTIHVADISGDRNTDNNQGMNYHTFGNGNAPRMPENRPQTDGDTYPNVVSIKVRDAKIKGGGQMYA